MSGLEDDLAELENETSDFVRARHTLRHAIHDELQLYHLVNGSQINTQVLDSLQFNVRQKVLEDLDGQYFERMPFHTQHKVVWDRSADTLFIIVDSISAAHDNCIPEPE